MYQISIYILVISVTMFITYLFAVWWFKKIIKKTQDKLYALIDTMVSANEMPKDKAQYSKTLLRVFIRDLLK